MLIVPVTARAGTVKVTVVGEEATTAASTAPTLTTGSAPVLRFVPVTTTELPSDATAGVKLVIFGSTLKTTVLAPVPIAFVMLTGPVAAAAGTTTCSDVAVTAVGTAGAPPLNVTRRAPVRFLPAIFTEVPGTPTAGANAVARGGCTTVRAVALSAAPSSVVTPIFPVTAPSGTRNRSSAGVLDTIDPGGTVNAPTFTTGSPVAARRFVPVTSTIVALPPTTLGGVKPAIAGGTLKLATLAAVPIAFVMLTGPVSAPGGTTTWSDVAVTAVGSADAPPPNVTRVAPVRFVPVIFTGVPASPDAGANAVARGGCTTVRFVALTTAPPIVVTPIFPVTAPSGTRTFSNVGVLDTIDPGGTVNAPIFTPGSPVAARRAVPLTAISSGLPATAWPGVKLLIAGSTLKIAVLAPVPTGLVTLTGPAS